MGSLIKQTFADQSQKLYDSTKNLKALKDSDADDAQLEKAVEDVHDNYVALEGLFALIIKSN